MHFTFTCFTYYIHLILQLWQAFVGVRARRVENYYQNLLSPDTTVESKIPVSGDRIFGLNLESVGVPDKLKAQIEKVTHSSLHMK